MPDVSDLAQTCRLMRDQMDRVVLGQDQVKEQMLVCLLAGGHGLLEGVPGTGKTLLGLSLAQLLGCRFKRIQFTPDLMPADLLGSNVFNQKTNEFEFHPGPIFTDLLLADEINRTPPRTQSALLEAMQEHAATTDGVRREISPVFSVFATQNPVEFEGTYPLPEAQTDRFLMKITIEYPGMDAERQMLAAYASGKRLHSEVVRSLEPVMSRDELEQARRMVANNVRIEEKLLSYILQIVSSTREDDAIQIGAGPRASLALLESTKALALLRGRDYVTPDDVKELAAPVLIHRITLSPETEMEGVIFEDILRHIFDKLEVPR